MWHVDMEKKIIKKILSNHSDFIARHINHNHVCNKKECYETAKNFDELTGEWYCDAHYMYLLTKREINYNYYKRATFPYPNITNVSKHLREFVELAVKKNGLKIIYEDTDIILLSKR